MKPLFKLLCCFVLMFCFVLSIKGQVLINEYSCANVSTITDNYNEHEDWFELYNTGSSSVNLTGMFLSDKLSDLQKWEIPSGVSIAPGSKMLVFASGRGEYSGSYLHANFKLTQTKNEHIILSDAAGNIIDQVQIIPCQKDHSRGRSSDGDSQWALFVNPSPGTANTNPMNNYAVTPLFNYQAGGYSTAINIEITSPESNVEIRYTTNGDEPLSSSSLYSGPVSITSTTVVRAKAFSSNPNTPPSFIETNTYFINDSHTIPVISVSGNQVDNLLNGGWLQPEGVFEYFSASQEFIDESDGDFNKHGNDSWAYAQRGFDFICRDEYGYNWAIHDQVFRIKDRDRFQRLIVKAAANDNYPFEDGAHIRDAYVHTLSQLGELDLDERTYEPCIVYVNGSYWGVYDLREKVDDHDFTDYYYNQKADDLYFLKTWGGTWSEYGGPAAQTDWNNLRNYITSNDMSVPGNFQYVDSQYDWKSLIDYIVLNSYVVCSDWLNWNTGWWKGLNPDGEMLKWRYILWDEDATFGHYINYTGVPDVTPAADPCNPEFFSNPGGQGHIPVLNALMNNDTFWQYYVSRYIDLSNTVFSCDYMQYVLDSLINIIEPEMPAQIAKWGGTYADWQSKVTEMKNFIDQRCADLSAGLIDCYDVTGPFDLKFTVQPEGVGKIKINSVYPEDYPFIGAYYGDIDLLLNAESTEYGYIFDHWEILHNTPIPGAVPSSISLNLTSSDTIVAVFVNPVPVVDLGPDQSICKGESIELVAGNPGANYSWSDGSTTQSITVSSGGVYSVTVENQGFYAYDSLTVVQLPDPQISLPDEMQICEGQQFTLSGEYSDVESFLWSTGENTPDIMVNAQGIYSLTVSNDCGIDSAKTNIIEGYTPVIDLGDDFNIISGQEVLLDASALNATYLWQDNSVSPTYVVTEPGTYWVIVTNTCGNAFDQIHVGFELFILVPNAFSPNGDQVNDYLSILHNGISEDGFLFSLYDRWGELVFETKNIDFQWDGSFGKHKLQTGNYPYLIRYRTINGEQNTIQGNVTILLD